MTEWSQTNNQWVDYPYDEWGDYTEYHNYVRNIWTDDNYVYAATAGGLNIIDLESEQRYAYVTYSGGTNCVWADGDNVYMATSDNGIIYLAKTTITGSIVSPISLTDWAIFEKDGLTNSHVIYIHGSGDHMVACTISGVDTFGPSTYYDRHQGFLAGAKKCFMLPNTGFYYTRYTNGEWTINRIDRNNYNWTIPDKTYEQDNAILDSGKDILDIFATQATSLVDYANTLFVATTSGVYVIDEGNEEVDIYYTGS